MLVRETNIRRATFHRPPHTKKMLLGSRSVVTVDSLVVFSVPVPARAFAVFWRPCKLFFGEAYKVAANVGVIVEDRPGDRVVVFAHSHESAEAKDCISNLAAALVDHDAFDLTDLISVSAVHRGAFNFIAANQRCRFSGA